MLLGGFCSGGDTKDGLRDDSRRRQLGADPSAVIDDPDRYDLHSPMLLHTMPKPTIAMVGGPAVGAGCSLAAACDLRFAAESAVFASNFSATACRATTAARCSGPPSSARPVPAELYYLNDKLTAHQAYAWGMVSKVVADDELRDFTMSVAERLLRTPATLAALMKDNLTQAEQQANRRRYLFGLEWANQRQAVAHITERMRRKAQSSS